jgi:hypothetical protein
LAHKKQGEMPRFLFPISSIRLNTFLAVTGINYIKKPTQHTAPPLTLSRRLPRSAGDGFIGVAG